MLSSAARQRLPVRVLRRFCDAFQIAPDAPVPAGAAPDVSLDLWSARSAALTLRPRIDIGGPSARYDLLGYPAECGLEPSFTSEEHRGFPTITCGDTAQQFGKTPECWPFAREVVVTRTVRT